jgi:hypothetical protein
MINLLDEDTIRLYEAAHISGTHFTSVYRWVLRGLPNAEGQRIRLEAIRIGRAWITSRQALQRFAERLTPRLDDAPVSLPRSASKRRRASEKAAQVLERGGI